MSWAVENWPVIGGFVAGILAWGKTANTANSARSSAAKAHERISEVKGDVADLKESLARVETHVQYMREGIDELRVK